jgi:hypothetical protein
LATEISFVACVGGTLMELLDGVLCVLLIVSRSGHAHRPLRSAGGGWAGRHRVVGRALGVVDVGSVGDGMVVGDVWGVVAGFALRESLVRE